MKKILFIRNTPQAINPNSYNVQEVGIGKSFCRMGYNYDYVCFNPKNPRSWTFYEYNGCKARWIEKSRLRWFRWGINLNLLDKKFLSQYDIIITREYYQLMTLLYALKVDNVSMYSGPYYNLFFNQWFSPIYDALFTRTLNNHLICKFVKSALAKDYMEKKGYTDVINVGVGLDTERFDNEHNIKPETQKIVNYMTNNRCILYVGALSDRKNYPFMLKLYENILKNDSTIKFVMIGKSKIDAISKLLGKKDNDYATTFLNRMPQHVKAGIYHVDGIDNSQLKYIYPLAKTFILPSKLEIFGMVLPEAMYCGAPVVTSKNGGSTTLIEGQNTGVIVPNFSVDEWTSSIITLMNNPDQTKLMCRNAHEIIKNKYTWDAIAKRMIDEIEKRS